MKELYDRLYQSCLIRVKRCESSEFGFPFSYEARAYHPQSDERFRAMGASDKEALHKLRGKIDAAYGKPRFSGN